MHWDQTEWLAWSIWSKVQHAIHCRWLATSLCTIFPCYYLFYHSNQELKLNNCGLGIDGAKMLAKALTECHTASMVAGTPFQLKVFIAGRNRLENPGATALAAVFGAVKTLEHVAIPQNGIYHVGISALSDGFRENSNMKILNLNDNTIGQKGASALADALEVMQK